MSSISALNKTLNEEKMRFHDELNPSIWEGNKLKDKVAMKLMEIASNFVAYLDVEGFSIEDIIITGSMANYNYTEQSDIDLHIICDYSKLPTNCPILSQEYFQAKKKIYNDKHNIKIYGYDVELYVEDSTAPSLAGGKYSLLQRKWLRFPQKIDFEVDDVIGTEELQDLITQIENVCMTDGNIEEANDLLNRIYEMRKSGLAKGGEFAFENLLFKALRNRGYLDKLRSYIAYAEDLSLSLNESVDNLEIKDKDGSLTLLQNGYIKAECSYTIYDNTIVIDWIESFDEGQGYATKLLEYIKNKHPDIKVISGEFVSTRIANVMKKLFGEPIRGEMPIAKDYDEYLDDDSKSSDMEFRLNESYLTEGIAEIAKKQFPKMSEDKLRKLVALDPTYKGGDQLGKYGQWIIRLFYNNIKNAERMADYKEFYEKNNGINPKTGQVIQKPDLLPQTPYEDADKIPNLLKQYDVLKKEIGQPIDSFKTIPDLYAAIQQHTQKGVPQDKTALERYNVFKACEPKGLKKIYEDNQWIIGIPTTFESSKPFGEFTNWCTTSSSGYYYDRYLNQYGGEYYILLDKTDGALYQFHFESNQFMDETDHQIDMYDFTKDYNNIAKFLYNYKMENNSPEMAKNKLAEKFAEIIKDPQKIQKEILYENYTSDVAFEGDNVTGFFNLKYLSRFVYYNNSRNGMNLETVCGLLTDFYDNFSFDGYSLRDFSYQSGDWKDIAQKYGVNLTWQDLCDVYDGEDSAVEDLENFDELQSLIQDDFYDNYGLLGFLQTCTEYGTQNECEKDILSSLSDNLPMYDNTINFDKDDDVIAKFSISKEDLWKIYYIMNKRSDDIPEYGKEIKIEKSEKPEMKADWFEFWSSKDDDYYGDDEEAFDDWLYCWRVATGKCDVEDFSNGSFVIDEPYYGWSGFDNKYFEEGCESAAKRIAEILGKTEKKVANESVEDNSYDDYDQILADLENAELTLRNGNQRQKYVNVINKYLAKVGSNIAELSWTGDFIDKVGTKEAQKAVNELYESFNKAEEKPKNLNEEIVYASKKDLSDIILKNPTRKEILEYDNPSLKHQDWRIAKDNNGNYYFGSGYDWIHFEMCDALKKQGIDIDVVFADYDGIASYDSKTNTFYIRDEYGEPELIEQEFNNSYLKKAFPNAKLEIDTEYDEMLESKQLSKRL